MMASLCIDPRVEAAIADLGAEHGDVFRTALTSIVTASMSAAVLQVASHLDLKGFHDGALEAARFGKTLS